MKLKIFSLFVLVYLFYGGVVSQEVNVDELLKEVFGTPGSKVSNTSSSNATTLVNSFESTNLGASTSRPSNLEGNTLENDQCECVPYYLCRNGTIVTNGDVELILDTRSNVPCENYLHICCNLPNVIKEPVMPPKEDVSSPKETILGLSEESAISPSEESNFSPPKNTDTPTKEPTITASKDSTTTVDHGDNLGCGWTNSEDEFPWIVEILRQEVYAEGYFLYPKISYIYQCYGALIHPKAVITAAHCVEKFRNLKLKIRAGIWETQVGHKKSRVRRSYIYEDQFDPYQITSNRYDFLSIPYEVTSNPHGRSYVYKQPSNLYQVSSIPYQVPTNGYLPPTDIQPDMSSRQEIDVDFVKIHPDFCTRSLQNDIAILFLEQSVKETNNAKTICLPPPRTAFDNTLCFVAGNRGRDFGQLGVYAGKRNYEAAGNSDQTKHFETEHHETEHHEIEHHGTEHYENKRHPSKRYYELNDPNKEKRECLQLFKVPTVDKHKCEDELRKTQLGHHFCLQESFLCAGGEVGNDVTINDGGSPLVCPIPGSPGRYQQAGFVSWGIGNLDGIPKVYVDLSKFRDWIDEQMECNILDRTYGY